MLIIENPAKARERKKLSNWLKMDLLYGKLLKNVFEIECKLTPDTCLTDLIN